MCADRPDERSRRIALAVHSSRRAAACGRALQPCRFERWRAAACGRGGGGGGGTGLCGVRAAATHGAGHARFVAYYVAGVEANVLPFCKTREP